MNKKVFIIAEIGVNHNGDMSIAKKMIDVCEDCGVDAVKFQSFKTENIVSKDAPKAEYQISNTGNSDSQFDMLKKLELSYDDHKILIDYCNKKNIVFLSTPFDIESLNLLIDLGLSIIKIPSGEITNLPFLEKIGKLNKSIILSTGISEMFEIKEAMDILIENGTDKSKITILHCNTEYPTPMEDVNLTAMNSIKRELGVKVGYSDHTQGIEISLAAAALGAEIIEKHFTLDKNMEGPDHKASIEPDELKHLVSGIRNIERALGNGNKVPSNSELKNINIARKSIVAKKDIKKGEILSKDNLATKRPGNGISPMKWNEIIGKNAKKNFKKDEIIII